MGDIDIIKLYEELDNEPELKEWGKIHITVDSDTNIHPYIAELICDMINSSKLKVVVELAPHHGVLTRLWAQYNQDTQFIIVGMSNNQLKWNIGGMSNIQPTLTNGLNDISMVDMVIINYGLSQPDYDDISMVMNILYKTGGALVILGYDSVKEKYDQWDVDNDCVKRVYSKMNCSIYEVSKNG
jgi:hypothetical protein